MSSEKVIVALDRPTLEETKALLEELKGIISYYKIGFELFTAFGWEAVKLVKSYKAKVFLDLKLHDIPNTVAKTAAVICDHDVDMFNVHALGGLQMMQKVREIVNQKTVGKGKPTVIAVTILTSHREEALKGELGISKKLQDQVLDLAKLTEASGLDGVVCSPQEVPMLRGQMSSHFRLITPGIRPKGSSKGDQQRTLSPKEALDAGSDFLVIGRPITAADAPRDAAANILKSLSA